MPTISKKVNYINGSYKPGVVYKQFKSGKNYNMIIGFDFGDGECTLTLLVKKEITDPKTNETKITWSEQKIYTPDENRIPTVLAYKDVVVETPSDNNPDETVQTIVTERFIGSKALKFPIYYFQFKHFPGFNIFNSNYPSSNKRFNELMSDFLKTLWKEVLDNPLNEHIKRNLSNTLLVVGYPAGGRFTQRNIFGKDAVEKYREFLHECLKCDVVTLPEPTAAIFGSIYDRFPDSDYIKPGANGKIILNKGVCVCEPGSSTLDFSYINVGKKMFSDSIDCAGRDIDRAMLDHIKFQKGLKAGIDYSRSQERSLIYDLKIKKEDFYSSLRVNPDYSLDTSLTLKQRDAAGRWNISNPVGFTINNQFFDNVLSSGDNSWCSRVGKFINGCKGEIPTDQNGQYICKKAIVSGGTGNVTQFQDIVRGIFNWEENLVCISKDPFESVSRGLAYIKALELTAANHIDDYIGQMEDGNHKGVEAIKENHFNKFADDASEKIAKAIIDGFELTCVECYNSKISIWNKDNFNDRLNVNIGNTFAAENIDQDYLANYLWEIFKNVDVELLKEANKLAATVYKSYTEDEQDKPEPIVELNNTVPNFNREDFNDKEFIKIMSNICAKNDYARVAFSGSLLNELVVFKFLKGGVFTKKDLKSKIRTLQNSEKRTVLQNKVGKKIRETLTKNNKIKNIFSEYVKIQAEIYLGKALLVLNDD